mmetsp:Transcript_85552/g.165763  ORF Transcript_85552/g.165763 Transcript_85552/m.165763 type:complete len:237 (-) Transcript_85552:287-997(-)
MIATLLFCWVTTVGAWSPFPVYRQGLCRVSTRLASTKPIQSPFAARLENEDDDDDEDEEGALTPPAAPPKSNEPLPLTLENVEMILDEMRPYLISDGGNVEVNEIDGPIVRLQLIGACGTCPSSTMTMKMGLEKRLKEAIPEIEEVVQALPDTPDLTVEEVNTVLEGIRPFLAVAGGSINVAKLSGVGSVQPLILLKMEGASATLQSVKLEIMQRIQRHFMLSGLRIEWDDVKKGW